MRYPSLAALALASACATDTTAPTPAAPQPSTASATGLALIIPCHSPRLWALRLDSADLALWYTPDSTTLRIPAPAGPHSLAWWELDAAGWPTRSGTLSGTVGLGYLTSRVSCP